VSAVAGMLIVLVLLDACGSPPGTTLGWPVLPRLPQPGRYGVTATGSRSGHFEGTVAIQDDTVTFTGGINPGGVEGRLTFSITKSGLYLSGFGTTDRFCQLFAQPFFLPSSISAHQSWQTQFACPPQDASTNPDNWLHEFAAVVDGSGSLAIGGKTVSVVVVEYHFTFRRLNGSRLGDETLTLDLDPASGLFVRSEFRSSGFVDAFGTTLFDRAPSPSSATYSSAADCGKSPPTGSAGCFKSPPVIRSSSVPTPLS
jgi:hypothetical protein